MFVYCRGKRTALLSCIKNSVSSEINGDIIADASLCYRLVRQAE